jgi:hypothetical protein
MVPAKKNLLRIPLILSQIRRVQNGLRPDLGHGMVNVERFRESHSSTKEQLRMCLSWCKHQLIYLKSIQITFWLFMLANLNLVSPLLALYSDIDPTSIELQIFNQRVQRTLERLSNALTVFQHRSLMLTEQPKMKRLI